MSLLGAATLAWWSGLAVSPAWRRLFLGPEGEFARDLAPFAAADLAVLVPSALAAALGIARGRRWARAAAWTAAGATAYAALATAALWSQGRLAALGALTMAAATLGAVLAAWSLDWDPDRPFRVATSSSPGANLGKTLTETIVLWGVFLGAFPILVAATERELGWGLDLPAALRPAGWTLLALASALGLWSGCTMAVTGEGTPLPRDTARRLVVSGPYRWLRNPMTVAGLAQAIGVGLVLGSWAVVLYALTGAWVWNCFARPAEERDLAERFGGAYERYRATIPCWRPSLRPFDG
jgi:protein-S-isoprenylcysteine O-methyltransferase Ste14